MPKSSVKRSSKVTTLRNGMAFPLSNSGKILKSTKSNMQRVIGDNGISILKKHNMTKKVPR